MKTFVKLLSICLLSAAMNSCGSSGEKGTGTDSTTAGTKADSLGPNMLNFILPRKTFDFFEYDQKKSGKERLEIFNTAGFWKNATAKEEQVHIVQGNFPGFQFLVFTSKDEKGKDNFSIGRLSSEGKAEKIIVTNEPGLITGLNSQPIFAQGKDPGISLKFYNEGADGGLNSVTWAMMWKDSLQKTDYRYWHPTTRIPEHVHEIKFGVCSVDSSLLYNFPSDNNNAVVVKKFAKQTYCTLLAKPVTIADYEWYFVEVRSKAGRNYLGWMGNNDIDFFATPEEMRGQNQAAPVKKP